VHVRQAEKRARRQAADAERQLALDRVDLLMDVPDELAPIVAASTRHEPRRRRHAPA
jgi:hypothetical protein